MTHIKSKNPKNDVGETPLHMAAQEGHLEVFKSIVELVADKNPGDDDDETPLDLAVSNGHFDVVDYISKHIGPNQIKNADYCGLPTNNETGLFNAPLAVQGANSGPDDRSGNKADDGCNAGSFYNPGDVPGDVP